MRQMLLPALVLALLLAACSEQTADNVATEAARGDTTTAVTDERAADATATDEPAAEPTSTLEPTAIATATTEPTPEPTNTPAPTATPQPTSTPTPVPPPPTATPAPQPVVYSGSGANVIDIQKPGDADDAVLVYVRGNAASSYFAVESFDAAGTQVDLLVNTTDPYEGVVLMDIRDSQHSTRLQITSDSDWYIELRPLASARRLSIPGTLSGAGDDVVIIDGEPDIAHIAGNADGRYFSVTGYGEYSNLLVNTTDPFDGRVIVAKDTLLIEVNAVGGWEISFE